MSSSSRGAPIPTEVRLLCVDVSMDGWMVGWLDGWMDGSMSSCGMFVFVTALIGRSIDR